MRDRSQPNHIFPKRHCFSLRPLLKVFYPIVLLKPPAGSQSMFDANVQLL